MDQEKNLADRLEVAADDLVRRINLAARNGAQLHPEIASAAAALEAAIKDRETGNDPLGGKASFLIERQGDLLQKTKDELKRSCARVADMADEKHRLEGEIASLRARLGHEPTRTLRTLQSDAQADLASHQEHLARKCILCRKPLRDHAAGRCPREENRQEPRDPATGR